MYEETTHSFVVKVWLEEAPRQMREPLWRGHVTHVMSKQQRYVQNFDDMVDFIAGYLPQSEFRLPLNRKLRRWIRRMMR